MVNALPLHRCTPDREIPCKICRSPSHLFDVTDFSRSGRDRRGNPLPLSGYAVYYHRCSNCGFAFTTAYDEWTEEDFKKHIYNDVYLTIDLEFSGERPARNADFLVKAFSKDRSNLHLLDYGSGDGQLAKALSTSGFSKAESYDPFYGVETDQNERFDIVTCFEVMEHVPEPRRAVAEIVSFLKQDGIVLFTTLLQPDDFDTQKLRWWYATPRNGHVSLYSEAALKRLWAEAGYQVQTNAHRSFHIAYRSIPEFAQNVMKPITRNPTGIVSSVIL